jgi:hypothetical protein
MRTHLSRLECGYRDPLVVHLARASSRRAQSIEQQAGQLRGRSRNDPDDDDEMMRQRTTKSPSCSSRGCGSVIALASGDSNGKAGETRQQREERRG